MNQMASNICLNLLAVYKWLRNGVKSIQWCESLFLLFPQETKHDLRDRPQGFMIFVSFHGIVLTDHCNIDIVRIYIVTCYLMVMFVETLSRTGSERLGPFRNMYNKSTCCCAKIENEKQHVGESIGLEHTPNISAVHKWYRNVFKSVELKKAKLSFSIMSLRKQSSSLRTLYNIKREECFAPHLQIFMWYEVPQSQTSKSNVLTFSCYKAHKTAMQS